MSRDVKWTNIVIERSDGSRLESENAEHAAEIESWYASCETMACIHGGKFTGKPFKKIAAAPPSPLPVKEEK